MTLCVHITGNWKNAICIYHKPEQTRNAFLLLIQNLHVEMKAFVLNFTLGMKPFSLYCLL